MTDLHAKFASLQQQLTSQHDEMMTAIGALTDAVGAPAPGAKTLDDVVAAINATNSAIGVMSTRVATTNTNLNTIIGKLNLIEARIATFHADVTPLIQGSNALLGDTNALLSELSATLDMINSNASLNTQRLLLAITANDPCRDCGDDGQLIAPPPVDVTPQPVDQEHCKRMQALIYALRRFTVKLDVLSSFGVGFSPTVIKDAINELWVELGFQSQAIYPSLAEISKLISAAVVYVASNVFSENSLPAAFMQLEDGLLQQLYAVDNANSGHSAYNVFIENSGLSEPIIGLFQAMGYSELFNLYYNRAVSIDTGGFSGTKCGGSSSGCEVLFTHAYESEGINWTSSTYQGYDRYNVISEPTAGDALGSVLINGETWHTEAGQWGQTFNVSRTDTIQVRLTKDWFVSGTITLEGCIDEAVPS